MITFVPYADNKLNARVLDMRRLGKQRVEGKLLLQDILDLDKYCLNGNTGPDLSNHPSLSMWHTYPEALMSYTAVMCLEWKRRGYEDNILEWLKTAAKKRGLKVSNWPNVDPPWWWGKARVHMCHRAALLNKDRLWYKNQPRIIGQKDWVIPDAYKTTFGYIWPTADHTYRDLRR